MVFLVWCCVDSKRCSLPHSDTT
ncbi:hypothetical protein L449_05396, partial [Klebsiella pneumoniae BIDMC 18B]